MKKHRYCRQELRPTYMQRSVLVSPVRTSRWMELTWAPPLRFNLESAARNQFQDRLDSRTKVQAVNSPTAGPTPGSTWHALAGSPLTDALLEVARRSIRPHECH